MSVKTVKRATVVVIGAGQAGLSAGFHLQRSGFASALETPEAARTFVMLDANSGPGGAWQHRWESLRVGTLNAIFDLPRMQKPQMDPQEPSRSAVPRYFGEFEEIYALPILRPVTVERVTRREGAEVGGFVIESSQGTWEADYLINATGTWNNPTRPEYPGAETFEGMQVHTRDYRSLDDFAGKRTAIVGGGISALQQLEEISRVTRTVWYTRKPLRWMTDEFDVEYGREVIRQVTADVEAGRPTGSVVSYTGLPPDAPYTRAARERGALQRRPMFTGIEPHGVREADGTFTSLDVIVWATGFKGDLRHLDALQLRNELGGVQLSGTQTAAEPRLHLIGFGPSQSTVGANRAGRDAVRAIEKALDAEQVTVGAS
ncbi:MAG: flavin-containing monooxygenase [Micrococcaceae bacterium]